VKRLFGYKRESVTGQRRKLIVSFTVRVVPPNIIMMIKSRRMMAWSEHAVLLTEKRNAYNNCLWKI
jgi:hypothetical protein